MVLQQRQNNRTRMPANKQAFVTIEVSVQLDRTECQIKVSLVDSTAHKVLHFSHLPSFHFQSSPPIYVIDGSGLWITKHCKLKSKERRELSVWSSQTNTLVLFECKHRSWKRCSSNFYIKFHMY